MSYAYLRAGIPVVLGALVKGVGEHAIALVGYRIGHQGSGIDETRLIGQGVRMRFKGSRIVELIGHDDQMGPYSVMTVRKGRWAEGWGPFPLELDSAWTVQHDGNRIPTTLVPFYLIIPLHDHIRVPFGSPLRLSNRFERALGSTIADHPIEWDIFLSTVNDYKTEIAHRMELDADERNRILCRSFPRFFWRVRAFSKGRERCEMLVDATDMERSFQAFALNVYDDSARVQLTYIPRTAREVLRADMLGRPLLKFIDDELKRD